MARLGDDRQYIDVIVGIFTGLVSLTDPPDDLLCTNIPDTQCPDGTPPDLLADLFQHGDRRSFRFGSVI